MSARLKGWQDPSEHSPVSGKPILLFVEDKETGRRYQTTGIYFAHFIPTSDVEYNEVSDNADFEQDEIQPGYYYADEVDLYVYSLPSINVALLYWSYLPDNPKLI